jgi:hypothetical protein
MVVECDVRVASVREPFVPAAGGSGKSHVLRAVLEKAPRVHAVRAAPHGSAAAAMSSAGSQEGETFFKVLMMRVHAGRTALYSDIGETWSGEGTGLDAVLQELRKVHVLWVDEAAATQVVLLVLLDRALQAAHDNDEVFGGVQVIFTYDVLQLMPPRDFVACEFDIFVGRGVSCAPARGALGFPCWHVPRVGCGPSALRVSLTHGGATSRAVLETPLLLRLVHSLRRAVFYELTENRRFPDGMFPV